MVALVIGLSSDKQSRDLGIFLLEEMGTETTIITIIKPELNRRLRNNPKVKARGLGLCFSDKFKLEKGTARCRTERRDLYTMVTPYLKILSWYCNHGTWDDDG